MARFAYPVALLLCLAGCPDESVGPGGAGGACTTNRDCPSGEICFGKTCSAGVQKARCRVKGDCKPDEWCDIVDETCKPILAYDAGPDSQDATSPAPDAEPPPDAESAPDAEVMEPDAGQACAQDPECGPQPQNVCEAKQCIPGCGSPGGLACTGDTECSATTGRCTTPSNLCQSDGDCHPAQTGAICESRRCVPGCGPNPARCAAGTEVCDSRTSRCVPISTRCTIDTDCTPRPPQRVCETLQCVPGCGEPGGIQCSGSKPICNRASGRCDPRPPCARDLDCGNANEICVMQACTLRCDRPGGATCAAPTVCNPGDGRCVPGALSLGTPCGFDAQCGSGLCLTLTRSATPESLCASACSGAGDCPLDFSCLYLSGMRFCVNENLFSPPATWDTPAGGACSSANITCQSDWCNTNTNVCIETCSRDSDCSQFGGNCFTYARTQAGASDYDHLCVEGAGSVTGRTCFVDSDCRSGICDRYVGACARQCCADRDCASFESCNLYDLDATQGLVIKVCEPRSPTAGAAPLGAACASPDDCESEVCAPLVPTSSTSPRKCSTLCCTESDCAALPQGGHCRPFAGPTVGTLNTIIGACLPN